MNNVFPTHDHALLLFSTLRLLGVSEVLVNFSGSGDSGNVDEVVAYGPNNNQISLTETSIQWRFVTQDMKWDMLAGKPIAKRIVQDRTATLDKIIESMCNNALDTTELDWWNNEGGQGQFRIVLDEDLPKVTLNVGVNEMVTHDHWFEFYEPMTSEATDASVPSQPE